jgi:hypothetical protein
MVIVFILALIENMQLKFKFISVNLDVSKNNLTDSSQPPCWWLTTTLTP